MPEQCELAGRELDAQVARVLGWRSVWVRLGVAIGNSVMDCAGGIPPDDCTDESVPRYSTDANAALAAYGVMRERGWRMCGVEDRPEFKLSPYRVGLLHDCQQRAAVGTSSTFAEALSRAIVAASEAK